MSYYDCVTSLLRDMFPCDWQRASALSFLESITPGDISIPRGTLLQYCCNSLIAKGKGTVSHLEFRNPCNFGFHRIDHADLRLRAVLLPQVLGLSTWDAMPSHVSLCVCVCVYRGEEGLFVETTGQCLGGFIAFYLTVKKLSQWTWSSLTRLARQDGQVAAGILLSLPPVQGLQTHIPTPGFLMWVLGVWTQIFTSVWEGLYRLSHLPAPTLHFIGYKTVDGCRSEVLGASYFH